MAIIEPAEKPDYYGCAACGSLQLWPLPRQEMNLAFESDETATSMVETDLARRRYLLRRLELLPQVESGRLLDVGCATGRVMALAAERGWNVAGIEMSEALAHKAWQANPGVSVLVGDILKLDLAELGKFEAIVALDVIEHVLDPAEFLRRLRFVLMPGGILLLQTPNARSLRSRVQGTHWNMRIPEYHFHLFSPMGLQRLLERNGFTVTSLSTASGTGTEGGIRAMVALIKENLLAVGLLGNALVVAAIATSDNGA